MAETREPLPRYLALLELIPRAPRFIDTPTLLNRLHAQGFNSDIRALQRDLSGPLMRRFPLQCDDSHKPFRWSFPSHYQLSLPGLDLPQALAWVMAEAHLSNLLPEVVLAQLEPQFNLARKQLDGLDGNGFGQWAQRVRTVTPGLTLLPARIEASIWQAVTDALLRQQALAVRYLSRTRETESTLLLHPQGLVSRHGVSYLVALVNDYDDPRHFALHRLRHAAPSDKPWREATDFDLDTHIQEGAFAYREGPQTVRLVAEVAPSIAWLLSETPLCDAQTLYSLPGGEAYRLEAEVPDDKQTLWWLRGLGAHVHVLAPAHWREDIREHARRILARE
ncbi:WYL domain-containing protein [Halomonas sp. Bachu 37]|uniref:helix-turn-helix transcriptional regulator n=1 Tax=Halomonas kashgarensis TaxID=3084920 RepID=UPI0032172200